MSVRKSRVLLAELNFFSISDVVIHQGRSNLGILTGAKMLQFFGNIISDLARLELAAGFMKSLIVRLNRSQAPIIMICLSNP